MKATLLQFDIRAALTEAQIARSIERAPGIHSSDIIKYIVKKVWPKRFADRELDPALLHTGFLWEDTFAWAIATQLGASNSWFKQMELEEDGIWRTLDGFDRQKHEPVEFKATKMSARNPITSSKFLHWRYQLADYCYVTRSTTAKLFTLHMNGSYELGGGRFGEIVCNPWHIEFEKEELMRIHDLILRTRDKMVKDREYMSSIGKLQYAA